MGLSKEPKSTMINIRVTETTKKNLELLIEKLAEETGFVVSQSDVITNLINKELDKKLGYYSPEDKWKENYQYGLYDCLLLLFIFLTFSSASSFVANNLDSRTLIPPPVSKKMHVDLY